jgi:hypothetical protein
MGGLRAGSILGAWDRRRMTFHFNQVSCLYSAFGVGHSSRLAWRLGEDALCAFSRFAGLVRGPALTGY